MQIDTSWFDSSIHLYLCSACVEFVLGLIAAIAAIVDFRRERTFRGFIDLTVAVGLFMASGFTFRGVYLDSISNDAHEQEVKQLSNDLADAKTELKKLRPVPVEIRLRDLLNSIDPIILKELAKGQTVFEAAHLDSEKRSALLALEPETHGLLKVSPETDFGTALGGAVVKRTKFILDPFLRVQISIYEHDYPSAPQ